MTSSEHLSSEAMEIEMEQRDVHASVFVKLVSFFSGSEHEIVTWGRSSHLLRPGALLPVASSALVVRIEVLYCRLHRQNVVSEEDEKVTQI